MRFRHLAILIVPLLAAAVPASAQRERPREKDRPRHESHAQQSRQAEPRHERAQPVQRREATPPRVQRREAPPRAERREEQREQPRAQARAREESSRRAVGTRGTVAVPRGEVRQRVYVEPRVYGYARPRAAVPVIVYPRPYYSFRPRYFLGFGLYLGYAIPYPVAYGYPTYVYGAPAAYAPEWGTYGGLSFDIIPDDASVIVDGSYVGMARDFSPLRQPLTLTAGRHHVELQAADREPVAFDVEIAAGQVLPYRGALQRY
jgi:hypothetical protein